MLAKCMEGSFSLSKEPAVASTVQSDSVNPWSPRNKARSDLTRLRLAFKASGVGFSLLILTLFIAQRKEGRKYM